MESLECWLPVPDWEGLYEVSDMGRVRSLSRRRHPGRILKPTKTRDGFYWRVDLSRNGEQRTRLIHQLVLEAFVGPRPEGMVACHGPARSLDNRLSNLSYGTVSENNLDKARDGTVPRGMPGQAIKLTWEQVTEIRRRATPRKRGIGADLALEFGVSRSTIYDILSEQIWKTA